MDPMSAATRKSPTDTHSLSLRLPTDLAEAARARAIEEDRTMTQLIRVALRQYLARPVA